MMAGLEPWAQQALSVGSGLIAGVLVGLERGFKLRNQQEGHRVAGIRTFSLLGLGAGVAGLISRVQPFAAGAILLGMLGYLALAYAPVEARQGMAQKIFYLHVPSATMVLWVSVPATGIASGGPSSHASGGESTHIE